MNDTSDRPDWLPGPPAADAVETKSLRRRLELFLPRLPSLVLVALGCGMILLAASLPFTSLPIGERVNRVYNCVALLIVAAVVLVLAAMLRNPDRWREKMASGANPDSRAGMDDPARTTLGGMSERQFFACLLRAMGIWLFAALFVELPNAFWMWRQTSSSTIPTIVPLIVLLGPFLRAVVASVLLFVADKLARLFYRDR